MLHSLILLAPFSAIHCPMQVHVVRPLEKIYRYANARFCIWHNDDDNNGHNAYAFSHFDHDDDHTAMGRFLINIPPVPVRNAIVAEFWRRERERERERAHFSQHRPFVYPSYVVGSKGSDRRKRFGRRRRKLLPAAFQKLCYCCLLTRLKRRNNNRGIFVRQRFAELTSLLKAHTANAPSAWPHFSLSLLSPLSLLFLAVALISADTFCQSDATLMNFLRRGGATDGRRLSLSLSSLLTPSRFYRLCSNSNSNKSHSFILCRERV